MTTQSKIKKLQEHHCYKPLIKQLEKITKKKFPECLNDIEYIIMLDRESNRRYVLENGNILTTQCKCICGVNIRYNYFFRVKNTINYFVIGDTCQINISNDLDKLTNENESNVENQEATANWKKMRVKAIREKKSIDNENNECFENCKICNLKLVRAYYEPKEGDEYLKEKKYKDKRKEEVCTDCLEKNVMNCDTCKKEMCIQLRNDKVQATCISCRKNKYGKTHLRCIECNIFNIKKANHKKINANRYICRNCRNPKEIKCKKCSKHIRIEPDKDNHPKIVCKRCWWDVKSYITLFWKKWEKENE